MSLSCAFVRFRESLAVLIFVLLAICLDFLGGHSPTVVNVNTFVRSIDKIDDYKMVSGKFPVEPFGMN